MKNGFSGSYYLSSFRNMALDKILKNNSGDVLLLIHTHEKDTIFAYSGKNSYPDNK